MTDDLAFIEKIQNETDKFYAVCETHRNLLQRYQDGSIVDLYPQKCSIPFCANQAGFTYFPNVLKPRENKTEPTPPTPRALVNREYAHTFAEKMRTPEKIDIRMEIMRRENTLEFVRRMRIDFSRLENELIIQVSKLQLTLKGNEDTANGLVNEDPVGPTLLSWIPK